ncbi:alpha/beta fold hydrolase [Corynebacterium comes]|uniref:Soluble epoxide hydrolase n=1 Tax=Corynebacterium comes TaxID=2675218 RepID=A0A6B8VX67_9CORY|nr:alpha/beta hydrolase [Corynebacterium comes]QGU03585.1 Soluble epoxide hydrolase [Corynebacterium comes]
MFKLHRPALSPSVVELEGPFTHELVHTRGVRLHAAVAGDPGDPLVVLLHGAFSGWFDFRDVIAPLAARGLYVAAVDARGYGMSDKPPATAGGDLRTAAGDIAGLIRSLGHDSAVVVGSDTGGTVAWALATKYPEFVAGLVSVSSAHPVDLRRAIAARPWNFPWLGARALLSRLPLAFLRLFPGLVAPAYRRQLRLNTTSEFGRSPAFEQALQLRLTSAQIGNAQQAILRTNRLLTAAVSARWLHAQVQAPTLLIQPPQRQWRHLARRSRARVVGPVEVTHVRKTRNLPQLENPTGFVDVVADFAARLR